MKIFGSCAAKTGEAGSDSVVAHGSSLCRAASTASKYRYCIMLHNVCGVFYIHDISGVACTTVFRRLIVITDVIVAAILKLFVTREANAVMEVEELRYDVERIRLA